MTPRHLREWSAAYAKKRLRRAVPSTSEKYEFAIGHLEKLLGRPPTSEDLSDDTLAEYQDYLAGDLGLSEETAVLYAKKLLALWRFGYDQNPKWIEHKPDVQLLEPPEKIPIAWTRDELGLLFRSIADADGHVGGVPAPGWWKALHLVIWQTLERVRATLSVPMRNVDFEQGWIIFEAKTRKGKTRDKIHRLGPDALEALRAIREPRRELLFPFPHGRDRLWAYYRVILQRAGLPTDRKHMFHCLRKSGASHLAALGIDPSPFLDHSDPALAKKHYIDPRIAVQKHAADYLFRPAG